MKWQNPRNEKMKRILRFDWLPEGARWTHFPRWGFPALVPREKVLFWSRWHILTSFSFAFFYEKNAKEKALANNQPS